MMNPPGNGRPPIPFNPGFKPLDLGDVTRKIHDAGYPEVVLLHPYDWACVLGQTGVQSTMRDEENRAYVWFGNTKITCAPPKKGTLDLSEREQERIIIPPGVMPA